MDKTSSMHLHVNLNRFANLLLFHGDQCWKTIPANLNTRNSSILTMYIIVNTFILSNCTFSPLTFQPSLISSFTASNLLHFAPRTLPPHAIPSDHLKLPSFIHLSTSSPLSSTTSPLLSTSFPHLNFLLSQLPPLSTQLHPLSSQLPPLISTLSPLLSTSSPHLHFLPSTLNFPPSPLNFPPLLLTSFPHLNFLPSPLNFLPSSQLSLLSTTHPLLPSPPLSTSYPLISTSSPLHSTPPPLLSTSSPHPTCPSYLFCPIRHHCLLPSNTNPLESLTIPCHQSIQSTSDPSGHQTSSLCIPKWEPSVSFPCILLFLSLLLFSYLYFHVYW